MIYTRKVNTEIILTRLLFQRNLDLSLKTSKMQRLKNFLHSFCIRVFTGIAMSAKKSYPSLTGLLDNTFKCKPGVSISVMTEKEFYTSHELNM